MKSPISQQDLKKYNPNLYRVCSDCGLNKRKTDFNRKQGRCKLCQAASYPSCGCGCGIHSEKDYKIYASQIGKQGTYYLSQKHLDIANGLNRKELNEWGKE